MTSEQILIVIIICAITIVTIIFGIGIVELQMKVEQLTELVDKLEDKLDEKDNQTR